MSGPNAGRPRLPVIDNIVLACPGNARELATFYAELLGMSIIREDWLMVAKDENSVRLAFEDGRKEDYVSPRWPDPEYPQQVHLDIPVSDLHEADGLARRLGAVLLQDHGEFRSYGDPVGHPFCLYRDPTESGTPDRPLSGRIGRVVIDCFSPRSLAGFYAQLLDMSRREVDTPERVVLAREDGRLPALAFQHAVVPAPRWPDPAYPQQVHLDLWVEHSQAAQELALQIGAIPLPDLGGSCPVFADPAGHPFCLCVEGQ